MNDYKSWPVQDAQARFSEFLDECLANGPQVVARRGAKVAVLVPIKQWNASRDAARPSLKELLLRDEPHAEVLTPERAAARRRQGEP